MPLDYEKKHENSYGVASAHLNATVPEQQNTFEVEDAEDRVCPKCGYPLRSHTSKCPNCNYDVEPTLLNGTLNHRATRMENPANESNDLSGTLNPYMMSAAPAPTFILHPVKRTNEKKDLTDLEYEGAKVVLTRSNTEPDNHSITSQQQALLTNSEGKWFIEDLSEQGTTFIRVSRKTEVREGDTILLGNRLFEFHQP